MPDSNEFNEGAKEILSAFESRPIEIRSAQEAHRIRKTLIERLSQLCDDDPRKFRENIQPEIRSRLHTINQDLYQTEQELTKWKGPAETSTEGWKLRIGKEPQQGEEWHQVQQKVPGKKGGEGARQGIGIEAKRTKDPTVQRQEADDRAARMKDSILAQQRTDDQAARTKDSILAQQRTDDQAARIKDSILARQSADDRLAQMKDSILEWQRADDQARVARTKDAIIGEHQESANRTAQMIEADRLEQARTEVRPRAAEHCQSDAAEAARKRADEIERQSAEARKRAIEQRNDQYQILLRHQLQRQNDAVEVARVRAAEQRNYYYETLRRASEYRRMDEARRLAAVLEQERRIRDLQQHSATRLATGPKNS
jgi:hypothetical protein